MIKINNKQYRAEQAIEVHHINVIPIQPVDGDFDVQDHIKKDPISVQTTLIMFDDEITLHGQWQCSRIDGEMVCNERTGGAPNTGTYQDLIALRDNREIFTLDCSEHQRASQMIYPDMAITELGQSVRQGDTHICTVLFTQITKTSIATEELFIQEVAEVTDEDGNVTTEETIRWSKEPIEPTTVEELKTPPPGAGQYPPDKYGRTFKVPNIKQFAKGILDTASFIIKGAVFGGNV